MSRPSRFAGFVLLIVVLLSSSCSPTAPTGTSETPAAPTQAAPTPPDGQPITISFACRERLQELFVGLADSFHLQNPSIQVQVLTTEVMEDKDPDPFSAARRVMSGADTGYYHVDPHILSRGLLRDLTPMIEADPALEPEDFYPGTMEAFRWRGRTWALPSTIWVDFLYYDSTLFDRAGVPYPALDWGPSGFLSAAKLLTSREDRVITQYGYWDENNGAAPYFILPQSSADYPLENNPDLRSPEVVDRLRWYTDLALRYQVMPARADEGGALFDEGKVAMWTGRSHLELLDLERQSGRSISLAALPTVRGPTFPAYMYGYVMSAGTEHPQESWRWLTFLTHQRIVARMGDLSAHLPARRSVAEQSGYWEQFEPQDAELVRYAAEHLSFRLSSITGDWVGLAVGYVLQGRTIEESLARAQASANNWLTREAFVTPAPVSVAPASVTPHWEGPLLPQPPTVTTWFTYTFPGSMLNQYPYSSPGGISVEYPADWSINALPEQGSVSFFLPATDAPENYRVGLNVYNRLPEDRAMTDPYTWRTMAGKSGILWTQPISIPTAQGLLFVWGEPDWAERGTSLELYAIYYSEQYQIDIRLMTRFDEESLSLAPTLGLTETLHSRFGLFEHMAQSVRIHR